MILLAIDTSGKDGSIGLARVSESAAPRRSGSRSSPTEIQILDVVPLEGGAFSAQLVPQISLLIAKHGFAKGDIGAFAVASGPGSFTGLRVGLAAIKALAEILQKPIAAVSRLEAVARSSAHNGRILAALDAGRREVYLGEYEVAENVRCISERLVPEEEFLAEARNTPLSTPDGNIAERARAAGMNVELVVPPASDAIARLGWEKIRAGVTVSPEDLEANYIRRSDAEIFAKK